MTAGRRSRPGGAGTARSRRPRRSPTVPVEPLIWLLAVGATLVAFAEMSRGLGREPWLDELATLEVVDRAGGLSRLLRDVHPPLFALIAAWLAAGRRDWRRLRLPSALATALAAGATALAAAPAGAVAVAGRRRSRRALAGGAAHRQRPASVRLRAARWRARRARRGPGRLRRSGGSAWPPAPLSPSAAISPRRRWSRAGWCSRRLRRAAAPRARPGLALLLASLWTQRDSRARAPPPPGGCRRPRPRRLWRQLAVLGGGGRLGGAASLGVVGLAGIGCPDPLGARLGLAAALGVGTLIDRLHGGAAGRLAAHPAAAPAVRDRRRGRRRGGPRASPRAALPRCSRSCRRARRRVEDPLARVAPWRRTLAGSARRRGGFGAVDGGRGLPALGRPRRGAGRCRRRRLFRLPLALDRDAARELASRLPRARRLILVVRVDALLLGHEPTLDAFFAELAGAQFERLCLTLVETPDRAILTELHGLATAIRSAADRSWGAPVIVPRRDRLRGRRVRPRQRVAMSAPSPLWPDPDHDRLLRAALLDRAVAQRGVRPWRRDRDLDALDPASTRLLPLVARNLEGGEPPDDPFQRRVAAVARAAWLKAQTVVARARPLLAALGDAGVSPLLIKGWAVAPAYAGDAAAAADGRSRLRGAPLRARARLATPARAGLPADRGHRGDARRARPAHQLELLRRRRGRRGSPLASARLRAARRDGPRDRAGRRRVRSRRHPLSRAGPRGRLPLGGAARRPLGTGAPGALGRGRGPAGARARRGFDWDRLVERARAAHAEAPLASALDYLGRRLGLAVPPRQRRRLSRPPLWRRIEHRAALTAAPSRSRAARLGSGDRRGSAPGGAARRSPRRRRGARRARPAARPAPPALAPRGLAVRSLRPPLVAPALARARAARPAATSRRPSCPPAASSSASEEAPRAPWAPAGPGPSRGAGGPTARRPSSTSGRRPARRPRPRSSSCSSPSSLRARRDRRIEVLLDGAPLGIASWTRRRAAPPRGSASGSTAARVAPRSTSSGSSCAAPARPTPRASTSTPASSASSSSACVCGRCPARNGRGREG